MEKGISNSNEEDLILISDNDEIPNLESKDFIDNKNSFVVFKQAFFIINLIIFMIDCHGLALRM